MQQYPGKRVGRRRYTLFYAGMLVLKIIAAIAVMIAMAKAKAGPDSFMLAAVVVWTLLDVCLYSIYRGRLVDVSISPYCLLLLYGGTLFWAAMPLFVMPAVENEGGQALLFTPSFIFVCGGFGMIWMVSLIMRVFLIFKKGESYGIS